MRIKVMILILQLLTGTWLMGQATNIGNSTWQVKSDVMSGMVKQHNSLPETTTIRFNADGAWISNVAIEKATSGIWKLKKRQMVFTTDDGKEIAQFSLVKITHQEMVLVEQKKWRKRTITLMAVDRAKIIATLPLVVTL